MLTKAILIFCGAWFVGKLIFWLKSKFSESRSSFKIGRSGTESLDRMIHEKQSFIRTKSTSTKRSSSLSRKKSPTGTDGVPEEYTKLLKASKWDSEQAIDLFATWFGSEFAGFKFNLMPVSDQQEQYSQAVHKILSLEFFYGSQGSTRSWLAERAGVLLSWSPETFFLNQADGLDLVWVLFSGKEISEFVQKFETKQKINPENLYRILRMMVKDQARTYQKRLSRKIVGHHHDEQNLDERQRDELVNSTKSFQSRSKDDRKMQFCQLSSVRIVDESFKLRVAKYIRNGDLKKSEFVKGFHPDLGHSLLNGISPKYREIYEQRLSDRFAQLLELFR